MNWFRKLTLAAIICCVGLLSTETFAQDAKKEEGTATEMAEDPMMAAILKYGTPGPEHTELQKMVGNWDVTTTMWMAPGTEPQVSKGSAVMTSVLGGRWIRQEFTGDFMGTPFHGLGHIGYDKFKQQYVSTWMDDMSTMTMTSFGTPSADGKVVTYTGVCDDPMTGTKDKVYKSTLRNIDDNTTIYEMYDKGPDGQEFKMMEIKYTRGK